VELLRRLAQARISEFVFPGRPGRPLSDRALLALLERMERTDLTVHGFRSTFRGAAEVELKLLPRGPRWRRRTPSATVEAAYRRGDLLEKRRRLMEAWATFAAAKRAAGGAVIPMRRRKAEA
jgi:hypothetical protein